MGKLQKVSEDSRNIASAQMKDLVTQATADKVDLDQKINKLEVKIDKETKIKEFIREKQE